MLIICYIKMIENRNTLSAIKLFQLFGGRIAEPNGLGISEKTLRELLQQEILSPHSQGGYQLSPLPPFLRPPPYHLVKELLPYEGSSFFNQESVVGLGSILRNNKIETVVELGCWHGISTIFMAAFLPLNGTVYAVDHWQGSAEHTQNCSMLYNQFLSNVIRTRLTDQIVPIKMTTLEASRKYFPPIDLIYVDASHDEDSVLQDLEAWYPHIEMSGGILCGDDFFWGKDEGYPVQKALKRFTNKRPFSIENRGTFWQVVKT